jgi:hypothetical protein
MAQTCLVGRREAVACRVEFKEWRGKGKEVGGRHLLMTIGYAGQRGKKEGSYGRGRVEPGEGGEGGGGRCNGRRLPSGYRRWQLTRMVETGCRTGEGGGHRQRSAGATEQRGRTSRGPGVSGGVREGERRARQHGGGALTCRPEQHSAGGAV